MRAGIAVGAGVVCTHVSAAGCNSAGKDAAWEVRRARAVPAVSKGVVKDARFGELSRLYHYPRTTWGIETDFALNTIRVLEAQIDFGVLRNAVRAASFVGDAGTAADLVLLLTMLEELAEHTNVHLMDNILIMCDGIVVLRVAHAGTPQYGRSMVVDLNNFRHRLHKFE